MEKLTDQKLWDRLLHAEAVRQTFPRPRRRQRDFVIADLLHRYLNDLRGGRVLELGCGGSVWMPYLALRCGMKVSGVDFSPAGLEKSRIILQATGVEAELIEADILNMEKHHRGAYDVIFSLGVLEHFSEPRIILETVARLLRSGGLLLSWVPSSECLQFELNARWNPEFRGIHFLTDREGWIRYHTEAGFDVLEASYTQWMDFSFVTFPQLSPTGRKAWYRVLATTGLPIIWLGRFFKIHIRSRRFCAGIIMAAKKG